MADVAAFVLAGGQSSRMGSDKASLLLGGRTLLERMLDLARSVTADVHIVGPRAKFGHLGPVIEDTYTGCGPLAGIHAALAASKCELNLILALDTPFLEPHFLRYLVEQAAVPAAVSAPNSPPQLPLVTFPRIAGQSQPLCAVYRRAFGAVAEASLRAGRYKIDPLFANIPCREIHDAELVRLAFDPQMFDNLNTPDEWEQARKRGPAGR